jgi:hypothetical protein
MNKYYDNILRKGKSVNHNKQYWGVLFNDSFYDYKSVTIYDTSRDIMFSMSLEIVFLFDKENRIKKINILLLMS